jgi:hypothetical protein
MKVLTDTKKLWHVEFDGLADMVSFIKNTEQHPDAERSSERETSSASWDLNTDMPRSLEIAEAGGNWAEGIDKMAEGVAQAAEQRQGIGQEMVHSVQGFAVDVPAYLAGDPDNMWTMDGQAESSSAPVITIGIASLNSTTSAAAAANRGIAAMSLVDVLEEAGHRCEVKIIWDNASAYGGNCRSCLSVLVKNAGEPWQPGPCSFMMAHPAARRRLGFAVNERGNAASAKITQNGYGHGRDTSWPEHGVDIGFDYMLGDNGYRTLTQALKTAERLACEAGFKVQLTATD